MLKAGLYIALAIGLIFAGMEAAKREIRERYETEDQD